ncbi:MAG: glutathione S-transferase family protein [Rhodobacteraceae bacterium]|nr:glutathione S-transferase family protein [Paracoccaceae bacterium]
MITVYGRANSLNVQLVMWTLAELGLACERLDFGHSFGGLDTPEFRAMNPNGLVPVLRDDHVTLWESCAILRYLAARYARAPFWPEDPAARAPVDMWAEWGKGTLQRDFAGPIFWATIRPPAGGRDPAAVATTLETFDRRLAVLDAQLGDAPFVTGRDFTLADIVVGHVLYRYFTLEIPRAPHPTLDAYYARLTARPAYAQHVMISYEALRAPKA